MSKCRREWKLPEVNVAYAVDQFKRAGGQYAEELVKLLETITENNPESGEEVPRRPHVRRIGKKQEILGKEISCEVFYIFTADYVKWLKLRWWIS